jgi:AraC family transcriptional regulator, transcriptional activator of pobA
MRDIPVHQLQERVSTGLEIKHFLPGDKPEERVEKLGAHRDDHYIFFMLEVGGATLMIDFHELVLKENTLYYILPGQVHHRLRTEVSDGWYIAVDTLLIPPDYRDVFENQLLLQQPFILDERQLRQCKCLLELIQEKNCEDEEDIFHLPVVHSLLQSFIGIAAAGFGKLHSASTNVSRPAQLSQQFKKLLVRHVCSIKSPSVYASKLNISESYLNEVLKKTTGLSVSYWILNEVMLEARRLLYYSQLNVKEITHKLGYDDPAYFSRLFKKATNTTPLAFRERYRK